MVRCRTFGSFTDVRKPEHRNAYWKLLVPDADYTHENPSYLYSMHVVQQECNGVWKCPLQNHPFVHRKKKVMCKTEYNKPELVMKHISRHMTADSQELGGYVYFVDTNNQTVAVTLTSYLNVRGPLKDDFDNAVHMLCDSECAVCNRIATPAEGIKQCGSCPCTVHQDCLPEDEVTESAEYYCSDCRDTDKIVWKENGADTMKSAKKWKSSNFAPQTPPGDYPNSSSCSLDESSNYDNAITIEKDKCVADRLLSELRMRTILDMRRDENATKIELKRIQVDQIREDNEQKRLCLEDLRLRSSLLAKTP